MGHSYSRHWQRVGETETTPHEALTRRCPKSGCLSHSKSPFPKAEPIDGKDSVHRDAITSARGRAQVNPVLLVRIGLVSVFGGPARHRLSATPGETRRAHPPAIVPRALGHQSRTQKTRTPQHRVAAPCHSGIVTGTDIQMSKGPRPSLQGCSIARQYRKAVCGEEWRCAIESPAKASTPPPPAHREFLGSPGILYTADPLQLPPTSSSCIQVWSITWAEFGGVLSPPS